MTIKSVLLSVYRQRRKAVAFAVTMIVAVFVILLFIPKKYESDGKLFVRLGRGGVTLDPTTTTSQTITVLESREAEINSVVDIMTSRGILEEVASHPDITPARILETSSLLGMIGVPSLPFGRYDAEYEQHREMDLAVAALQEMLEVSTPLKAATVTIWCKTESPELSKLIVDTLMETYIKHHVLARKTDGSFSFFETQFAEQEKRLHKATNRLSEFKNEIGVMSIVDKRKALRNRISLIENRLIDAGSNLAATATRLRTSADLMKDVPETLLIEETEGAEKQGTELMRDRLYDLELQEKLLLSQYTKDHPTVISIRAQVEQAREIMDGQADRKVQKKGVNTNLQALKLNMMNDKVSTTSVTSEQKDLLEQLKRSTEEMTRLNRNEIRLGELTRDVENATRSYRIYSEKKEEARINHELDEKQISNVKIVQAGSYRVKHVSPRKSILLVLTSICALIGAFLFALIVDRLSGTLYAPEDFVNALKVDLLGTVPSLDTTKPILRITHAASEVVQ